MCIKRRATGVTLIELVVFIMILSIAVTGILGVMSMITAASADPLRRKQALMIAESVMEEVQLAYFTFCDPTSPNAHLAASTADCVIPENWGQTGAEPANARPYDNINDYVSAAGAPSSVFMSGANILDANGSPFDVNGYTVALTIRPAALGGVGTAGTSADSAVLQITVAVTYDGSNSIVLDGYRTRHAPRL